MHGDLTHPHRQQHRPVDDAGDEAGGFTEQRAAQQGDRQHPEQAEEERRDPHGGFVVAEQPQRRGFRPEEEDRFVEKRLPAERRRHVVAALDHFLRDRRVQPLVRIEQRRRREERRDGERQRHDGEHAPQVSHADGSYQLAAGVSEKSRSVSLLKRTKSP